MGFFEWRNKKKEDLKQKRKQYEQPILDDWRDSEQDFTGTIGIAIMAIALLKSRLAVVTPVEARACYSFVFECFAKLYNAFSGDTHTPPGLAK